MQGEEPRGCTVSEWHGGIDMAKERACSRTWRCPAAHPACLQSLATHFQAAKQADPVQVQARERFQFAQDFYVLSESQLTNYSLAGLQDGQDAYSGMCLVSCLSLVLAPQMDGNFYPATPVDYGVVYASKSFQAADKRRLWLGWVFEVSVLGSAESLNVSCLAAVLHSARHAHACSHTACGHTGLTSNQDSLGCTELCADGTPFIREVLQWQGAQTLMREITYNADTETLRFYPIAETRKL
eukprot:1157739-Pelagomonas_calceolata.AAC.6